MGTGAVKVFVPNDTTARSVGADDLPESRPGLPVHVRGDVVEPEDVAGRHAPFSRPGTAGVVSVIAPEASKIGGVYQTRPRGSRSREPAARTLTDRRESGGRAPVDDVSY